MTEEEREAFWQDLGRPPIERAYTYGSLERCPFTPFTSEARHWHREADARQAGLLVSIPVRLDATLCRPGEVWLESPGGEAVRVWPPSDMHGGEQ